MSSGIVVSEDWLQTLADQVRAMVDRFDEEVGRKFVTMDLVLRIEAVELIIGEAEDFLAPVEGEDAGEHQEDAAG